MPTKQQLEEAIRRAHAAGDANAVKVLGGQLMALGQPKKERFTTFSDAVGSIAKSIPAAIAGIPEGINNVTRAVSDPIGDKLNSLIFGKKAAEAVAKSETARRKRSSARLENVVGHHPIARDIGQVGGSMMMPGMNLLKGGKLARTGTRAIQGAVGGAATVEPGDSTLGPSAIGAGANVVLPPVVGAIARPIVSRGSKFLSGLAKPPTGAPVEALGAEAVERAARFKELGIDNPTTAMLTRNPTAFEFEKAVAKTAPGEHLAQQMNKAEADVVSEGQKLIASLGKSGDPEAVGRASQQFIEFKNKEMQAATTKLYDDVRDTRGSEIVGRMDSLREKMTDPDVMDNAAFDSMREGMIRRMERLGLISKDGRISKGITLNQAEELRKFVGGLGNGAEAKIRMMRGKFIEALDDDVVEVIGDDAFKTARATAKTRFEEMKKTFAGRILEEKIAPELLPAKIFSKEISMDDLASLKRTHLTGTPEQIAEGREAWNGLKAQGVEDLLNSAMDDEGRLFGGKLLKSFELKAPKLRMLLDPNEYKQLENVVIASRDITSKPLGTPGVDTTDVARLFEVLPPKVQSKWSTLVGALKTSAAHSAAFMAGGPAANVALGAGQMALGTAAQKNAANLFIKKIEMAADPKKAAAAIAAAKKAAETNPVVAQYLEKNGMMGGAAAATVGER